MAWETLQTLGIVAGGSAAAGLVLRFGIERFSEVLERAIDQFFDKEIARHKAQLEHERVMFSQLHTERASIIIELYRKFVQFERDMRSLTTGPSNDSPADELLGKAAESGDDFAKYYGQNKIYFPPDTCEAVESLQDEMTDVFVDIRAGASRGGRPEGRADVERWLADWRDVTDDEVPELKCELENHFRDLLGVDLEGGQLAGLDS